MATRQRKTKKVVEAEGVAHVAATFNNTTITITDPRGNTCRGARRGRPASRDPRSRTPFAATVAASRRRAKRSRPAFSRVHVRVQGPGSGRESAIQALASAGLQVKSISDVTPIPHNGCRPPKRRRV